MTELAWREQGSGYFLPVERGRITLAKDLRDEWQVRGMLAGNRIEVNSQNLAGAFNMADAEVRKAGNVNLYKRDARWRDSGPSEKQQALCRKLGIEIPVNATRGQVSSRLDAHFSKRRA